MSCQRSPSGFTLVEMVVVVVLGVLLLAMAVPAMQATVVRVRLEGVVNELGADLQYARAEAVRRRSPSSLAVNAQGSGYVVQVGSVQLKSVDLPADIQLSAGAVLRFDGLRGNADADSALDAQSSRHEAKLRVGVTTIGRLRLCTPDDSFGGYPSC